MSIVATVTVYLGIPLAVIAVVVAVIFASGGRSAPRYRPGRPFAFAPVWFVAPRPGARPGERPGARVLAAAPTRPALESGGATSVALLAESETGGARGTW